LDTGRKQFLPHLSSPICNVVVSSSGNSYVVKLADNSVMILSAREMQPSANVTGLQLASEVAGYKDPSSRKPSGAVAALHPQHPERLLVAVPASHHSNQPGSQRSNSAVLQTFDIRANGHISRQALARTNTTTLNVSPEGSAIVAPDVRLMDIMHDGKWLATVDAWTPHPQDVEAVVASSGSSREAASLRSEVFLKFWKWNASSDMWELVTRIDAPHFSENRPSTVLGLAARPGSHEFATLGTDSILRFWCPTTRHRSGLKTDPSEPHLDTWKCRSTVDLTGCIDDAGAELKSTSISFSEDGSVLAVCLPSDSGANDGLVLLVNAQNCTVHYRRTGVFFGNPCSVRFLGRYLIVAATGSASVWDIVDDVVKPIYLSNSVGAVDSWNPPLLAVNSRTQSFAIASRGTESSSGNSQKKRRRSRFHVKIYDVSSLGLVFQKTLESYPLALLSDTYSGDYIIVDAAASVQRLGCLDKASQKSLQPQEVTSHLNSGLASIFSRRQDRVSTQAVDEETSAGQSKGLAGVFGETPSFSLPSIGVLFRNVVQTLGSS
jgi:NET1-associated nuclear protein 1 (U3 small nucleolar RNA-associated protein 17)